MTLFLVWTLNCVYQDPKNSNEMFAEQFYLCHRSTSIKEWSKKLRYTPLPNRYIPKSNFCHDVKGGESN